MGSYGRNFEFRTKKPVKREPIGTCLICECSVVPGDDYDWFLNEYAHTPCITFLRLQKRIAKESG